MNNQSLCSANGKRRARGDPSFSSTLLDSIYRSIDKPAKPETGSEPEPIKKQRDRSLKRSIMIESWIEKQSTGPRPNSLFLNSVSLETESKPVRPENQNRSDHKIAKSKQPISPGRRFSRFLNSIFSSGNARRSNLCFFGAVEDVSFDSRSKTPTSSISRSSTRKTSIGATRTVRFYPVGVIVDEYGGSCGAERSVVTKEVEIKKQSINGDAAREFCKWSYGQKMKYGVESDGDDDVESCASSDLFELDHLIGGSGRYRDELPVYETTRLRIIKNI